MVQDNKLEGALVAIRDLAIEGRRMAFEKVEHQILQNYFDDLEYLPSLIIEKDDRTTLFDDYLKEVSIKYDLPYVYRKYNEAGIK